MATKRPPLFARDATGLVREFGLFDVMVLSSGTIWVASAGYSFFIAYFPILGPNAWIPLALVFGAVAALFFYLGIALMSIAMPRTGGDYVYISRIFSGIPVLGFMNNFVFVIWSIILMGESVPYVVSLGVVAPAYFVSLQSNNPALFTFASILSQNGPAFILGTIINIALAAIAIGGARWIKLFNKITFILAIVGVIVLVAVLFAYSSSDFQTAFNSISSQTGVGYNDVMQIASSTGWQSPNYSLVGALQLLPLMFFVFYGASFGAYYGGEVKTPRKTQISAAVLSILGGLVYFVVLAVGTTHLMGDQFFSALSWLGWGPGAVAGKNPFPTLPALNAIDGLVVPQPFNAWFQFFEGAVMILTYIPWFMTYYMWVTRCIFAWSFDRIIPEKFSSVSERFHTPVFAIVIIAIGMEIVAAVFIYTTFFYTQFNSFVGLLSVMILPSVAIAAFPFLKKDLFEASPPVVKIRVAGFPVISILGILSTIVTLYSTVAFLGIPLLGPTNPAAFAMFIGMFVLGVVIFYAGWFYRKSKGLDLGNIYKLIPPE